MRIAASPRQDPLSRKAESPHCDSLSRKAEGPRNNPSSHMAEGPHCDPLSHMAEGPRNDSPSHIAAVPRCDPSSRMVVRFRCRRDSSSRKAVILSATLHRARLRALVARYCTPPCARLREGLHRCQGPCRVLPHRLAPRITHFLDIEVIFYVSWGVRSTSVQFSISDTFLTCGNASASKLGEPLRSQLPKKSPLRRGFRPNYRHFWLRYPKNALFGVL